MLLLSTSGIYSSNDSTASDNVLSQPLNSIHPLQQSFYEKSSAEQYSHLSATAEAVGEIEPVLSSGIQEWEHHAAVSDDSPSNCQRSLLTHSANGDLLNCDNALLEMECVQALDMGKAWMINVQSLAVNSSLHKSDVGVDVIPDSGVDSSTLCFNETSSATVESSAPQVVVIEAKRASHGRSASEGGIFGSSQCFPNLPQHVCAHRAHEQGMK